MHTFRKYALVLSAVGFLGAPARAQCTLQSQEFSPPDSQAGDGFGYRIARAGDLAVMAAPFDDDRGQDAGSAYVAERDPVAGWSLAAKLLASNGAAGDGFGYAVALAGSTVLVGAPLHDAPATEDRGMVYAFERDRHGTWREVARLAPPDGEAGARFGTSLAADGERLLVGMPYTGRPVAGHALLYTRDPSSLLGWKLALEFSAEDPATGFAFGHAVALADDVLAVAGSTESVLPYSGSYVIHVRERDAGGPNQWGEVRSLASPTGTHDIFGYRIALTRETLAAVAPGEITPPAFLYGAVYLYSRGPGGAEGWGLAHRLYSPNAPGGVFTAEQCVLSGDWLVAGVPTGSTTGSVHFFRRNAGGPETWGEVATSVGPDLGEYAGYGQALALEGDELLIAASGYYFTSTPGEVYAYDLAHLARSEWRGDTVGVNVDSYNAGPAVLGGTFTATVDLATTGHPLAVLSWFTDAAEIPLPGGQVLLGENRFHHSTSAGPLARFEFEIPNLSALCGRTFVTQAAHVGGGLPFVLSNAEDVRIGVH